MLKFKPAYRDLEATTFLNCSTEVILVWLDINLLEMVSTGWKIANSKIAEEADPRILADPEWLFLASVLADIVMVMTSNLLYRERSQNQ